MKKQVCILTKSYKHGGYCVAGIDMQSKQWIRLVNSVDPNEDEIKKEFMFIDLKPIMCLDVVEFDFIKYTPNFCQKENWLVNCSCKPRYIRTLSTLELLDIIRLDDDKNFIFNKLNYLQKAEVESENKSLFIYLIQNLKIDVTEYENYGEIKFKYKCSFEYNGCSYSNISLTDPHYRDSSYDGLNLSSALIVASLPCIPYKDDLYYKFAAKIIPIDDTELVKLNNNNYRAKSGEKDLKVSPFVQKDILIQTIQTPGIVSFQNYEQLKQKIETGVQYYSNFEYSLSNYQLAIKHRDELKYVKTILEKTKKNIIQIYNAPLETVTNRMDELINLIKAPFKKVDEFIKDNEKESKKYEIYIFSKDLAISRGLQNYMDSIFRSPEFFDKKWLNASCSTGMWKKAVIAKIDQAAEDIKKIQAMGNDNVLSALAYYFQTLSIEKVEAFLRTLKVASIKNASVPKNENVQIENQQTHNSISKTEKIEREPIEESRQNISDSGVILSVANSLNPFTRERILGIDEKLKQKLIEIAIKLKN